MNNQIEKILSELDGFRMCDQVDYAAYSRLHDLIWFVHAWMPLPDPHKEDGTC